MPQYTISRATLVGSLVAMAFLITAIYLYANASVAPAASSGFRNLDMRPDTVDPRIADPKHGTATAAQISMEGRLYSNIRSASTYQLPATMTSDAYDVRAVEAEPTDCMLRRATVAREAALPEGQYTPWDEIETGFMKLGKKQPLALQS